MKADNRTNQLPSLYNPTPIIDEYITDLKDAEVDKDKVKIVSTKNGVWSFCISDPYIYKFEKKPPAKPSRSKERKFKEILTRCMLFGKSDSYQKIKEFFVEYKMDPIYITTKDCIEIEKKKHLAFQIDFINKNTIVKMTPLNLSIADVRRYCTQCIYALHFARLTHGNIIPEHIFLKSRDNIPSNIMFISLSYLTEICEKVGIDQYTKIKPINKYFPPLIKLNSVNPVALDTYCLAKIYLHLIYNITCKKIEIEKLDCSKEEFEELYAKLPKAHDRKLIIVLKDILTIRDVKARTFNIGHTTLEYLLILFALPLLEESEVSEYLEAPSSELALLLKKFNPDIDQHSLAFKNYIEESSTIQIEDKDKIKEELKMEKLFNSEFIISREVPKIYKAVLEVFYYKENIESFFINNNKGVCFDSLIMKDDVNNMSSENRVDRDRILILQVLYAIYQSDINLGNITPANIFKFHADIKILLIKLYQFSKNKNKKRETITHQEIKEVFSIFFQDNAEKLSNKSTDNIEAMVNERIDNGNSRLHKVYYKIFKYVLLELKDDNKLSANIKVVIFWLLSLPLVESEGDKLKINCPNDFEFKFISDQKRFLFQVDFDDLSYKRELLIAEVKTSALISQSDYIVKHGIKIEEVKGMPKEQIERVLRGGIEYPITLNDFVANNKQLKFHEQRKILAQILLAYYKNEIFLNRIEPADIYILKGYKIKIVNIRNIEKAQANSILNFNKVANEMKQLYSQYREKERFKLYEEYLLKLSEEIKFGNLRQFILVLFNIYQISILDLEEMLKPSHKIDEAQFNVLSLENIDDIKINCKSTLKIIRARKEVSTLFGLECISESLRLTENEFKHIFQEEISIGNLRSIIGQLLYFSCLNYKFYLLNEGHIFYHKETKRVVINEVINYYNFKSPKNKYEIHKYTNKFIEYINALTHQLTPPTKFNKNIIQRSKIKLIKILSKLKQCSKVNENVLAQIWHLVVSMPSLSINDIDLYCLNSQIDSIDRFNKQDTYPFFSDFQYTPNSCSLIYNKEDGVLSTLKVEKEDQLSPVYNLTINGVAVLAHQSYAEKSNNVFTIVNQSAADISEPSKIHVKIADIASLSLPEKVCYSLRHSVQSDYIAVIKGYEALSVVKGMIISLKLENGSEIVELIELTVQIESENAYFLISSLKEKKDVIKKEIFEFIKVAGNTNALTIAYKCNSIYKQVALIKDTTEVKLEIRLRKRASCVYKLCADDKEICNLILRKVYNFNVSVSSKHKASLKLVSPNKDFKLPENSNMEIIECYPEKLKCYLLADRKNIWNHVEGSIVIKMDEHILQIGYMTFTLVKRTVIETASSISANFRADATFTPSLFIKKGNLINLLPCKDEIKEQYKLVLYYTSLLREEYNSNKSNCTYGISSTCYGYTIFKDIANDLESLFCFGGFTKSTIFNLQTVPQTDFNKGLYQNNSQSILCSDILQIYLFNCHRYSFNSTPLYFVTNELKFTPRYCCSLVIQIIKKTPHLFVIGGKGKGDYLNDIEYTTFQIKKTQKSKAKDINVRDSTNAAFIEKDSQEDLFRQTTIDFDYHIRKIKIQEGSTISSAMAFPTGEREFLIFGNDVANLDSASQSNPILKACFGFDKSTNDMACNLKVQKGDVIGVRNFFYPLQVENFILAKNVNSNIVFAYDKESERAYYRIT
jgi:hypothetical protein